VSLFSIIISTKINHEALMPNIFLLEILLELINLFFILARFYKAILFTKLLFDQLPLFNPYKWPLSMIRILAEPWFSFWRKYFPPVRLGAYGFDISGLVAFEFFEFLLKFISLLKFILLNRLENVLTA
jgi:hypothetical protein